MRTHAIWLKLAWGAGFVGLAAWAIWWRWSDPLPQATAAPPVTTQEAPAQPAPPPTPAQAPGNAQQVVAYIYGNVPITREMLGEYLIARMGAQRLDNLINKAIIDHECRTRGIEVSAAEVEAGLEQDLQSLKMTRK